MTCPICEQKSPNCDCTSKELEQFCEIEQLKSEIESSKTTDEEKTIVMMLVQARELFLKLDNIGMETLKEFDDGIHQCQDVIRGRVAHRADPKFWF